MTPREDSPARAGNTERSPLFCSLLSSRQGQPGQGSAGGSGKAMGDLLGVLRQ